MLDFSSLKKAIISFKSAITVAKSEKEMSGMSKEARDTIKAGVIQNFEFTYELCWKFMKRWLEINLGSTYVDGVSRKELFRIAAEHQIINNVEEWMEYHECCNKTAHIYDLAIANEVFETAVKFIKDAEILLSNLQAKNA